jgi:hypothetical protein
LDGFSNLFTSLIPFATESTFAGTCHRSFRQCVIDLAVCVLYARRYFEARVCTQSFETCLLARTVNIAFASFINQWLRHFGACDSIRVSSIACFAGTQTDVILRPTIGIESTFARIYTFFLATGKGD